jgi:hypothetical protein
MMDRLKPSPEWTTRAVAVAAVVASAACSDTLGSGIMADEGECLDHETIVHLPPGEDFMLAGDDLTVDGGTHDVLRVENVDGTLQLEGVDDNGSFSFEGPQASSDGGASEATMSADQQPLSYVEEGQSVAIEVVDEAEDGSLSVKLDQDCTFDE